MSATSAMLLRQEVRRAMKLYKVGIYCRLSKDDASNPAKKNYITADESVSIENQYEMLSKICMMNGWTEVKNYRDDGYSGGDFKRPGFLQMLEDARHGVINLILVRDLSRLGRDFIEVGRYTDMIFPSLGCRFVSVLDCLDSNGDDTDMLHFRSLMNDYHLKDLSAKIKSVLQAKRKNGQYLTAYAPYGYRKSDEDKHHLVIDEEAAVIVRRIYALRHSGMAYNKITALLNGEGIPTPRIYWCRQNGKDWSKYSPFWQTQTVKVILKNEIYIGNLILNRRGHRSYKDKTNIIKPEDEWIRHESTHEAIIDRAVWEYVQRLGRQSKERVKNNAPPIESLFRGKIFCSDCGSGLAANFTTKHYPSGDHHYVAYSCAAHQHSGRTYCSPHTISELKLKTLIMTEIRKHAAALDLDENAVVEKLKQQLLRDQDKQQDDARQEISRLRRRVQELEQITMKLYEDKVSGAISEDTFITLIQKNEQERQVKTERLDALLSVVDAASQKCEDIQKWVSVVRKYTAVEDVDRAMLDELVEQVVVGEKVVIDGKKQQNVTVVYRFVGAIR